MNTIYKSMERADRNSTPKDSVSLMYSGEPPEHIAIKTRQIRAAQSRNLRHTNSKYQWNYTSYWFWLKASNRAVSYFSEGALIPGNCQSWETDTPDFIPTIHEATLFNHSQYGEGWEAMTNHCQVNSAPERIEYRESPRHCPFDIEPYRIEQNDGMSSLDRIIFEDCIPSADNTKVMAPHPNFSTSPYYLTPRWVISKIHYPKTQPSLRPASTRATSFSSSTPSPADLTLSFQNAQDFLCFWETIGNTRPLIDAYISWINTSGIAAALKYFGHLASQLSAATTNVDEFLNQLNSDSEPAPNEYAYHTIGEYEETDYYETIPNWFKTLLASIENCSTLEAVSALGKASFDRDLGEYSGVFWMHYNRRKKALTPRIVPKTELIIATINSTRLRSRLAKIGKRLYELQADPNYIPKTNWNPIWATYKERKAHLTSSPVQQSLF